MPVRSRVLALLLGALGATVFLGFSACDLDWSTRLDPVTGTETGPTTDAPTETGPKDATSDGETSAADVTVTDAACADLKTDTDNKLRQARMCTLGAGGCQLTTTDECGCPVVVENPTDVRSSAFNTAAQKLKGSGCDLKCPGTCPSTVGRNCLAKEGGALIECYPP
jgi:hypothetical protein